MLNKKWVDLKGTFRKLKTDCAEKIKSSIICSIKSKNGLLVKPGHKQKLWVDLKDPEDSFTVNSRRLA